MAVDEEEEAEVEVEVGEGEATESYPGKMPPTWEEWKRLDSSSSLPPPAEQVCLTSGLNKPHGFIVLGSLLKECV